MKIGKYQVQLSRQEKPTRVGKERSSAGSMPSGYFESESYLRGVRNPSVRQIMNMIDNDGTVQGLYNIITFPALATPWHLEPHPDDVLEEKLPDGTVRTTHPQADRIERALRSPEHMGGMTTPFSLVLANLLLGVAQGHRFFEIVYKVDEDGLFTFQKLAARDQGDYTILYDEHGGFSGVEYGSGKDKEVLELPYCFLYTYRKERNSLKGASAFRAAFYHYDKKHRLYFLQHQQAQANGFGYKTLEAPDEATQTERDENLSAVDKMSVRPSIALPFGWALKIDQPGKGMDMGPALDGHDVQMARSVLAHGMLQGNSSQTQGGSYALGESHYDVFLQGEQALLTSVEEHINAYLISKLHDYNYEKPLYATFKFSALNDEVKSLSREAFKSMVTKGTVPQWVVDGISDRIAEQLDIEKPADAEDSTDNSDNTDKTTDGDPAVTNSRKKKVASFANSEWWRELTAAEAKVQFSTLQTKANDSETTMLEQLQPLFTQLADDTTKRIKPILQGNNPTKELQNFTLNFAEDIRKVMNDRMVEMYSIAKTQTADEIKQKAPANKQVSKDLISQHVQSVVDKQYSDMLFNVKTIVTDAVRKNLLAKNELAVGDILKKLIDMFDGFYADKEPLTVSSMITTAINIGRDDVFQAYEAKIYGYQYSAILDDSVCRICEELDASVVTEAEYYSTKWMPPIHFYCRCIWVAIMSDEDDKPDFTGLPEAPGGETEPLLSRNQSYKTLVN